MKVEQYFVFNKKSNTYLEIEDIRFSKETKYFVVLSFKNANYIEYFIKDCVFNSSKKKNECAFEFSVYHKNENLVNFKGCAITRYSIKLNLVEILYDLFEETEYTGNFVDELILEQKYL